MFQGTNSLENECSSIRSVSHCCMCYYYLAYLICSSVLGRLPFYWFDQSINQSIYYQLGTVRLTKCKLRKNAQWRAASESIGLCLSMLAAHNENKLSICWLTKWGTKHTKHKHTNNTKVQRKDDRHTDSYAQKILLRFTRQRKFYNV